MFACTISAKTTPVGCFGSPTIVFDFTYTARGNAKWNYEIERECVERRLRFFCLPSPWEKNVMVTFVLSTNARDSNGCSIGAAPVKTTFRGMMWPSITFLSIMSGRGWG